MDENMNFGGGGFWIFALLILVFGMNGFGGFGANRNAPNVATQSDVVYTSAFNQLQDENTAIRSDIQRVGYENMATTKDVAYNNLNTIRDVEASVNLGFANQQTCCCQTQKEILTNRYEAALNTQKILDAMAQNKIDTLQAQVSELRTKEMLCGIPKVNPYFYGVYPYNNGCGGCGGTNI